MFILAKAFKNWNWLGITVTDTAPPLKKSANLDISTWESFQSEKLGLYLKYPKEWGLKHSTGYPSFISAENKCSIITYAEPTDSAQSVEQWFNEKNDLGGFELEVVAWEHVTAAKERGILAHFVIPPIKFEEPRKMGDIPINPIFSIQLFLPVPKEDYVFALGLVPSYEEKTLAPACKDVFNLMIKTLELKERKLE